MTAGRQPGGRRRGRPPPSAPAAVVVALRPDAPASPQLLAAAREAGGTVAVVLPLRVHGFALDLPNPVLLPTRSERPRAEEAITETVRALRRAGLDAYGQIVVTRKAPRVIAGIVRRRGPGGVLLKRSTAGAVRRFVESDPIRQLTRRVGSAAAVQAM
jgi:hypothetical protein